MKLKFQKQIVYTVLLFIIWGLNISFLSIMHGKAQKAQNTLIQDKMQGDADSILAHLYLSGNSAWFKSTLDNYKKMGVSCLKVRNNQNDLIYGDEGLCKKSLLGKNYMNEPVLKIDYSFPVVSPWQSLKDNASLFTSFLLVQFMLFILFTRIMSAINKKHSKILIEKESNEKILENNRTLSHNLKSPIAALKSLKENISSTLDDDEARLLDCTIESISGIAKGLIEDVTEYKIQFFEAEKAILDTVNLKRLEMKTRPVHITTHIETSETFIRADLNAFQSVISNVLNNAIEAIREEFVTITVKVREENLNLTLEIIDNGIGIDPSALKAIFKKSVSFGKRSGKGIGLFHAKNMVNSWGGSISAESTLKEGSKIIITLPVFFNPVRRELGFIDDQKLNRLNWIGIGKKYNIKVHTFSSYEEYSKSGHVFDRKMPFFVDYDLGVENGLVVAETLSREGFELITMASGHTERLSASFHQISKGFPLSYS